MGDFQAFAHSFVIWMPFIVVVPCLWIWAALIRGELHNTDEQSGEAKDRLRGRSHFEAPSSFHRPYVGGS
jgi:hypothetical protein